MIYEPAEDSLLLKKFIKKYAKGRILDMGTGSGVLALEAMNYNEEVEACDINKKAVKLVKKKGVKVYFSDLFSNVKGKFDLIMFNPPYLALEVDYCGIKLKGKDLRYVNDKAIVGGKYGYETLERFFKEIRKFLNKNGKVLIVVSSLTPRVEEILKENGFKFKILGFISFRTLYLPNLYRCSLVYRSHQYLLAG